MNINGTSIFDSIILMAAYSQVGTEPEKVSLRDKIRDKIVVALDSFLAKISHHYANRRAILSHQVMMVEEAEKYASISQTANKVLNPEKEVPASPLPSPIPPVSEGENLEPIAEESLSDSTPEEEANLEQEGPQVKEELPAAEAEPDTWNMPSLGESDTIPKDQEGSQVEGPQVKEELPAAEAESDAWNVPGFGENDSIPKDQEESQVEGSQVKEELPTAEAESDAWNVPGFGENDSIPKDQAPDNAASSQDAPVDTSSLQEDLKAPVANAHVVIDIPEEVLTEEDIEDIMQTIWDWDTDKLEGTDKNKLKLFAEYLGKNPGVYAAFMMGFQYHMGVFMRLFAQLPAVQSEAETVGNKMKDLQSWYEDYAMWKGEVPEPVEAESEEEFIGMKALFEPDEAKFEEERGLLEGHRQAPLAQEPASGQVEEKALEKQKVAMWEKAQSFLQRLQNNIFVFAGLAAGFEAQEKAEENLAKLPPSERTEERRDMEVEKIQAELEEKLEKSVG